MSHETYLNLLRVQTRRKLQAMKTGNRAAMSEACAEIQALHDRYAAAQHAQPVPSQRDGAK